MTVSFLTQFGPVVDGQRQPKPAPMPTINLLNIDLPAVHEVPLEMWFEANGWIDTVRSDLGEANGGMA